MLRFEYLRKLVYNLRINIDVNCELFMKRQIFGVSAWFEDKSMMSYSRQLDTRADYTKLGQSSCPAGNFGCCL